MQTQKFIDKGFQLVGEVPHEAYSDIKYKWDFSRTSVDRGGLLSATWSSISGSSILSQEVIGDEAKAVVNSHHDDFLKCLATFGDGSKKIKIIKLVVIDASKN